jgi:antitoxin component YwqK of YwqJK toxin-antitoxin module
LAIVAFLVAGACFYAAGYVPGTIRKNENGSFFGTGTAVYRYKTGAIAREDYYRAGRLKHSKWYKPDGSVVAETSWNGGTNVGYYLREDGTIRVRMSFLGERAHGPAIYYKEDGSTIDHVEEFRDGHAPGE